MITVASQVQLKAGGQLAAPPPWPLTLDTVGPRAPHKDLFVLLKNCREKLWSDLGAPEVLLAVANEGTALV